MSPGWTSVAQATGWDHIVYGWVFFGLVMAAVLAIGWRWFDRDPDAAWFDPAKLQAEPRQRADAPVASALVLLVASLFLGWSSLIAARAEALRIRSRCPMCPAGPARRSATMRPWAPNFPGADHFLIGRYVDARGWAVDLAVALYSTQHEGKELVGFGIGAIPRERPLGADRRPAGGRRRRGDPNDRPRPRRARDRHLVPDRRRANRERGGA